MPAEIHETPEQHARRHAELNAARDRAQLQPPMFSEGLLFVGLLFWVAAFFCFWPEHVEREYGDPIAVPIAHTTFDAGIALVAVGFACAVLGVRRR